MNNLRLLSVSSGDSDHAADIVAVTPKGTIRRINLNIVELAKLVQQAANLLDLAVREQVAENEKN
jgi:hypothetical protein